MKIRIFIIFIFIINQSLHLNAQDHLIKYEGKPMFINGLNVAWNSFGGDVGNHYLWGSQYNSEWFEKLFTDCENYGINCVRLWIHIDGRANPEFDSNGFVKGVDADFYNDFDDILLRAKNHGILVMPCLWSFDMCKDYRKDAGIYAGHHADLITDSLKTVSYINKVLVPMVKRYDSYCNLFAWEICNEPEWHMPRPGETPWPDITTVPLRDMQRFTGMLAAAIHKNSSKMVTTGSAALKWNSDVAPAIGNWWSDQALKNAYNDKEAYLDFYQIHYYDWMHESHYDPFDLQYPFEYWKLDKPCLIGEQPGNTNRDTVYTNSEKVENAYKNHYAGQMFWSYNGYDGIGSFDDFKNECKEFYQKHKEEIHPFIPCKTLSAKNLNFDIKKEKGKNKLSWKAESPDELLYFILEKSCNGGEFKKVQSFAANENEDPNYYYNDKSDAKTCYRLKAKMKNNSEATSLIYCAE